MAAAKMAKAKIKKIPVPKFTEEQIAARAYTIFEREGYTHGNHERHWHQAITELRAEARELTPEPQY
jgi:hypothetical protein